MESLTWQRGRCQDMVFCRLARLMLRARLSEKIQRWIEVVKQVTIHPAARVPWCACRTPSSPQRWRWRKNATAADPTTDRRWPTSRCWCATTSPKRPPSTSASSTSSATCSAPAISWYLLPLHLSTMRIFPFYQRNLYKIDFILQKIGDRRRDRRNRYRCQVGAQRVQRRRRNGRRRRRGALRPSRRLRRRRGSRRR